MLIGLDFQKNTFLMLPWVVLGIMLAVALLVSVLYTAIMFFVNSEVLNGALWLIFGLIAVGTYLISHVLNAIANLQYNFLPFRRYILRKAFLHYYDREQRNS